MQFEVCYKLFTALKLSPTRALQSACTIALFHWLRPFTNEDVEETGVPGEISLQQAPHTCCVLLADLTAACEAGCSDNTCLNNGYCYEHWRYANFTCDCSESDFSGIHCEKGECMLCYFHREIKPVTMRRRLKHCHILPVCLTIPMLFVFSALVCISSLKNLCSQFVSAC